MIVRVLTILVLLGLLTLLLGPGVLLCAVFTAYLCLPPKSERSEFKSNKRA